MKIERTTVEAVKEETGRSSEEETEEILKMLQESPKEPLRVAELQNRVSWSNSFRAFAKRRGFEVSISHSKQDKAVAFITAKSVPETKKKNK